jgi:NAD kinase
MATIALVVHQDRPEATEVAIETIAWLNSIGHDVILPSAEAERLGRGELGIDDAELGSRASVAVSLGGDGTMLRTVALVARSDVPVIGVNFGQLGYLTDVEPDGVRKALEQFLAGDYTLEERMMLEVTIAGAAGAESTVVLALNEAALRASAPVSPDRIEALCAGLRALLNRHGALLDARSARGCRGRRLPLPARILVAADDDVLRRRDGRGPRDGPLPDGL